MRRLLFILLAAAALAACENKTPKPRTDAALSERVKVALERQAKLERGAKIDVDANGGVVMIKGAVHSDAAKDRIQEVAKRVDGVTWVQNQVSVAPPNEPTG